MAGAVRRRAWCSSASTRALPRHRRARRIGQARGVRARTATSCWPKAAARAGHGELPAMPLTAGGRVAFQTENVLAAVGGGLGAGRAAGPSSAPASKPSTWIAPTRRGSSPWSRSARTRPWWWTACTTPSALRALVAAASASRRAGAASCTAPARTAATRTCWTRAPCWATPSTRWCCTTTPPCHPGGRRARHPRAVARRRLTQGGRAHVHRGPGRTTPRRCARCWHSARPGDFMHGAVRRGAAAEAPPPTCCATGSSRTGGQCRRRPGAPADRKPAWKSPAYGHCAAPTPWSRNTAIEAIVACDDREKLHRSAARLGNRALRARFPQFGLAAPRRRRGHGLDGPPAGDESRWPAAGARGLPGHLQPHRAPRQSQASSRSPSNTARNTSAGWPWTRLPKNCCMAARDDTAFRPGRRPAPPARAGRGHPPGPQHRLHRPRRRWRATSPIAACTRAAWCSSAGPRQRRIQAAETDGTNAISESIAQDKDLTKMLLDAAGVPVPNGRTASSPPKTPGPAAQELGGPVVVKPRDGSQGRGVAGQHRNARAQHGSLRSRRLKSARDVIVERYIPGHDFRLLVVGDTLVAAARRDPPQVSRRRRAYHARTGPAGQRGIRCAADGHATPLTKIRMDDIALSTLGQARLHGGRRAACGRAGRAAQQRQPQHRRQRHRRHRRGAPGSGRARRRGRA